MMLVSCAAETIFTGLGGGGFATVFDAATTQVRCLDFFVSVPGLGGKRAKSRHVDRSDLHRSARAVRDRTGDRCRARHSRRGALFVAAVGPAVLGQPSPQPGREASYGTPFPAMHAQVLPRVAAAMCVGEGVEVYQRPDGSLLHAGDPLRHPDHHRAYELMLRDPQAFYHGAYADALVVFGLRRRRSEPRGPRCISRHRVDPAHRSGERLHGARPR